MYADGHAYLSIAKILNDELIPSPRAKAKYKKKRHAKFWRKTTVREILQNPAYVGVWTFGKKKWTKDPITRRRRTSGVTRRT